MGFGLGQPSTTTTQTPSMVFENTQSTASRVTGLASTSAGPSQQQQQPRDTRNEISREEYDTIRGELDELRRERAAGRDDRPRLTGGLLATGGLHGRESSASSTAAGIGSVPQSPYRPPRTPPS